MSLDKYSELKEKIVSRMNQQVKDVKTITVEQWAKDHGYGNIYFDSYEDAKKWVDENINSNRANKKSFYEFESEVDENLEGIMEDLETGSSSKLERTTRTIANKYISPALKTLLKAVGINFVVSQGVGLGLGYVGSKAHEWATNYIDGINILDEVNFDINARSFKWYS